MQDDKKIRYYAGFTGFRHPIRLLNEVTDSQILEMNSYIQGTFDSSNNLVTVERFIDNKSYFKYEYVYTDKNKIRIARLLNEKGERVTLPL